MVGGWTVLALARLMPVTVIDFDKVELLNVGCQPFNIMQAENEVPKVSAIEQIGFGLPINGLVGRFPAALPQVVNPQNVIVISAVDSMLARRDVASFAKDQRVALFLDARVLGEIVAVLAAESADEFDGYLSALPSDGDVPDVPCGSQGTAYTGLFAAARLVVDLNNWCWGRRLPRLRVWDIISGMVVSESEGRYVASDQVGGDELVDGPDGPEPSGVVDSDIWRRATIAANNTRLEG